MPIWKIAGVSLFVALALGCIYYAIGSGSRGRSSMPDPAPSPLSRIMMTVMALFWLLGAAAMLWGGGWDTAFFTALIPLSLAIVLLVCVVLLLGLVASLGAIVGSLWLVVSTATVSRAHLDARGRLVRYAASAACLVWSFGWLAVIAFDLVTSPAEIVSTLGYGGAGIFIFSNLFIAVGTFATADSDGEPERKRRKREEQRALRGQQGRVGRARSADRRKR